MSTEDTYRCPDAHVTEAVYTEKRSKFLAFALPVAHPQEAVAVVKSYQQRFYDARHVCYAYRIGAPVPLTRTNDNGEPSGTAGKPILGQIEAHGVTNTLVIVVRYFGGIKLGTGGLVVAYRTAAAAALGLMPTRMEYVCAQVDIAFEYPLMDQVMRVVKRLSPTILQQHFEMDCTMRLSIRLLQYDDLCQRLGDIEGLRITPTPSPTEPL